MSTTTTDAPVTTAQDTPAPVTEAPAFSTEYRFENETTEQSLRESIAESVGKLRDKLTTARNEYKRLAGLFAQYRANVITASGAPDWLGESDRYRTIVSGVLDALVAGLPKDEVRPERNRIQAAIAYHTRKSVSALIVEQVAVANPGLEPEKLEKAQAKALEVMAAPSNSRSTSNAGDGSPEDAEAAAGAARTRVIRLADAMGDVAVPIQAEASLRMASALFTAVKNADADGIPGRQEASEIVARTVGILTAVGKALEGKASADDMSKAEKLLATAGAEQS